MAVSQRQMKRRLRNNVPVVGGGAVGLGSVVGLRQFVDVQEGATVSIVGSEGSMLARLTRPSSAYGLGVGGLSGLLWLANVGPNWLQDVYMGHAITAIPAGAASAAVPREPGDGGEPQAMAQRAMRSMTGGNSSSSTSGVSSGAEFQPAGGQSSETAPVQ